VKIRADKAISAESNGSARGVSVNKPADSEFSAEGNACAT